MRFSARYRRTRLWNVSVCGSQPMMPTLPDKGTTMYRWIVMLPRAVAVVWLSSAFTIPNNCIARSSCLRSSCYVG